MPVASISETRCDLSWLPNYTAPNKERKSWSRRPKTNSSLLQSTCRAPRQEPAVVWPGLGPLSSALVRGMKSSGSPPTAGRSASGPGGLSDESAHVDT